MRGSPAAIEVWELSSQACRFSGGFALGLEVSLLLLLSLRERYLAKHGVDLVIGLFRGDCFGRIYLHICYS